MINLTCASNHLFCTQSVRKFREVSNNKCRLTFNPLTFLWMKSSIWSQMGGILPPRDVVKEICGIISLCILDIRDARLIASISHTSAFRKGRDNDLPAAPSERPCIQDCASCILVPVFPAESRRPVVKYHDAKFSCNPYDSHLTSNHCNWDDFFSTPKIF